MLAFLFSITTTGALPRSSLDPIFDAESAAEYAGTFATLYPSRVPGSEGAAEAARWYRETIAGVGLSAEEDTWTEDLADLGSVELTNVVTVIPGQSEETIVVVAHRDNAGVEEPLGENATGTAALIELGRGFAPQEIGPDPLPQHTLVLVSTDAGAYGGAGAARFVAESPLAERAIAAVVLDDLGPGPPRLAIAGDSPSSPARTLVRTASVRVAEEVGVTPTLPSIPTQLVDLGVPFALDEQGRLLARGLSAVTLTTDRAPGDPALTAARLGQLGRATEALLSSLDTSVGAGFRTPDSIFFADRAASGWTARLTLVLAIVPFALGVVDLAVRGRRRRLPFAAAFRAQRARLGVCVFAGLLVWLGGLAGVLPTGAPLPLPPYAEVLDDPPVFGVLALVAAIVLGWLWTRPRLVPAFPASPEERLAGFVVALGLVGLVAIGLALTQPYALAFILPSLYAWLSLPLDGRLGARVCVYALGLAGPLLGLVLLGNQLGLSPLEAALYVVGLLTVGYLPVASAVLGLGWIAAGTQLAALASGRYAPYAGGLEPPPPGPLRRLLARAR
ncbi:MAG TPA: M28 family peptidase [Gaiellaceae bacterium]|nr:M28 family peptidase [Gaiellaceae bacterium]